MSQIVFNDRIDAALACLFVLVVISILYYGVRSCLRLTDRPLDGARDRYGAPNPDGRWRDCCRSGDAVRVA